MPISLQARMILNAISPRLAINIFLNKALILDRFDFGSVLNRYFNQLLVLRNNCLIFNHTSRYRSREICLYPNVA